ncbi:hypothetical protein C8A05DRAFT_12513 [Staphylotrichum tortipilum]|uniref:Uncharacterized protein n=1 Tax=Staphylotrichum tortipilum TaxID=2831512 RepID=A0AAN6MSP4_9PEZI|nr:hypothetical protein C8A05DRAFT_12513 [Staphylotrichum longicolle]
MEPTPHPAAEEKRRLQEYLEQQRQQQQQHPHSPASQPRSPASGSNSVPMTEEDLDSSPIHTQYSPLPSPPSSTSAVAGPSYSLNTTPLSPTPPPYSGPSNPPPIPDEPPLATTTPSKPPPRYPGLPLLDYRLYHPPLFDLSADKTTIKSTAPYLSSSAEALVALVRQQATVPPKPLIHVVGRRGASPTGGRVDFDIKLNLMSLLVPEDSRMRMDYLRCVGQGEMAFRGGTKMATTPEVDDGEGGGWLEAWAGRFVADGAGVKQFVLERGVVNLDTDWLEGQIRSLVAGMRYPGTVAVSFPVTHARIVVQNPDRVNKFITSVTGFFAGKRKYEVVKAVWPFATVTRGGDERGGVPPRRCAVQSEEVWWREWKGSIRHAIATKRHGWVTNEDKLEALMEGTPSTTPENVDWGPDGMY